MQKRVVGNINELNESSRKTAFEESANTAGTDRGGCKANKTSFGRFKKFAVIIMLLIVSVFCAIGSADWIISQQEQLPGGSGSTFVYDKKTLQNYIALKGSDETEAAAKVAEAEGYASLQTKTDSDDSAVADKFTAKKATVSKKSAVSTYANGLESAIYGKSAIYNGKPIVAIKKTAGIDNAVADLPSSVLNGSLLTSYKPLTGGSVTEADLTEAYFAEGATSGLPQNAGTYAILVKIKGLEAYGYAVKIFTILPCPVTVGWSGIDFANGFTYDGAAHPVTAAAKIASSDNGNIEGSEVNADLSVSIAKDGVSVSEVKTAGSYTLAAASGNDNYVIYDTEATRTTSFKVKQAPLAVTVNGKTITYGDTVTFSESDLTFKGFVGGETASVLGGTATFTHEYKQFSDVGTYTVTANGLTSENYKITYTQGTLTVIKYGLKLSWSGLTFVYDKTAYVPTAAITNPLPSGAADPGLNVSVTTGEAINAGSYTAKASVTDGNYSIASGETTNFTVTAKEATVTVNLTQTEILFGSEAPTAEITYSGVLDDDSLGTPEVSFVNKSGSKYAIGSPAGDYEATVSGLKNDNYKITYNGGHLTVNKARLTLVANVNSITYGEAPSANGYHYTGFLLNDNEQSANITGTVKYSFDYDQYDNIYDENGNKKIYYITPSVENFSSTNYTCSDIKKGTLTVNKFGLNIEWSDTDLKYTGKEQKPKATIKNPIEGLTKPAVNVTTYMPGNDTPISASAVGKYIAKASVSDGNYSISSGETTDFTISRIQVAIPTSGTNMLEYTGSQLTYTPVGFDENTMTIAGNTGSYITEDAYKAEVSLKDIYEWSDKTTETKTFAWYIVPKLVKFDGILEKTYEEAKTGITLDANVFTNLVFKNGEKANTQATGAASTIKVTDGNGNDYTETSPNNVVKVGSTYKAEIKLVNNYCFDIQVDEKANKCTFNRNGTTYIKYKTAKIGSTTYYTIEDAINFSESGDIVLASDSSGTTSYITTSFSKIGYYGGNSFTCGKNIIVPHANGKTTSETAPKDNKPSSTTKNVGSVLIVPEGISLTMNSATLDILAIVAMDGLVTCTTYNRGVVMNHGTIKVTGTINNGDTPNIKAYGYLKGTGNVIVTDGATAEDLFHIFDFKGGKNTLGIYNGTKEYLPLNSYSLHNISCNIRVYAGCTYNALYEIYMSNTWFTGRIPVVGKSDAPSALFKLSDGYLEKRAVPADNSTSKDLDTITGSNQLKGQKEDVKIYGTAVDGSITINVSLKVVFEIKATMQTGTNNPLPIPYMNIRVCKGGNLTLENSSYKFMPGSALIVDDGGSLTVGSNAKLVFYSVDECTEYEKPVTYKTKDGTVTTYPYIYMTNYCVDKVDAYFEINSNNTSLEGYISGKITTKKQNVKINIKNASATITVLNEFQSEGGTAGLSAKVSTRSVSMTATGNIITSSNYGESEFTAGDYTSYKIGNEYYWASSSILKTVTLLSDGKQYGDTITEIIGTTITLPTELQKKHYTFGGWSDGSTVYNGSLIVPSSDVTLNAVWTPVTYTINYEFWYNDQRLSDELTANIVNANPATFTCDKNITFERVSLKGYTFDKWYIESEFGTSVSQTSDALKYIEDGSVTITLYGRFIEPAYTITYYVNNDEISAENLKNFVENLQFEYSSANTYISYLENGTAFSPAKIDINDSDTTKSKYFLGWYTDENCETPFGSLSDATKVNLYAKWGLKAQIVVVGNNGTKTIEGYYHYKEDSTFTFAEADISSIVASGYKFIGAVASSDYTITETNTDNPNNITVTGKATATVPEVAAGSSNTAPQIKVTADIRRILTVDITMSASAYYEHKFGWTSASNQNETKSFSIDSIVIKNSMYSTDKTTWNTSTNASIIPESINGNTALYVLEGDTTITIEIKDVTIELSYLLYDPVSKTFYATNSTLTKSGCTYTSSHSGSTSTFVFTITDNATIKWSGKQT